MFDTTNRRDFLKVSALVGAGALLFGRIPSAMAAANARIGEITALALADDMLYLVAAGNGINPALRESLSFGINVFDPLPGNAAFFGRWMPAQADDIIRLAVRGRDAWAGRTDDDRLEVTLALASGWLIQRAGEDVIAPSITSDPEQGSIYQDAAILRARSIGLDGSASASEVASLFMQTVPRSMIRFHTLVPDYDDGEGWVLRLQQWRKDHEAVIDRTANAFTDASSASYRRFVVAPNFYDAEDPVLRMAESARTEEEASRMDLAQTGTNASLYGKALARGMADLLALNAFLDGSIDAGVFERELVQA